MDLLIGIAIGSFVTNTTHLSTQQGGTLPDEMQAVNSIVSKQLKNQLRIGKFITPFIDRVQPLTNDELRKMVKKWCETPDAEKPPRQDKQHISNWDTSLITNMSKLFENMHTFNDDISQWNTSRVENMDYMFNGAFAFNQPIGVWNTSKVTNTSGMFAESFNQPIGNWDTSNVTDMSGMFAGALAFNHPINTKEVTRNNGTTYTAWDTSNVTDMSGMFADTESFNQPIGNWDTSNVTDMSHMFNDANSFNQPIGNWDTSNVTDMSGMFASARAYINGQVIYGSAFNQDISGWDTRSVKDMSLMFNGAKNFKQNVDPWNTDNVTNMTHMFYLVDRIPNWPYKSNRGQPQLKAVYVLEEDDVEEIMEDLRQEYSKTEDTFNDIRTILQEYESTDRYIQDIDIGGHIYDLAQKDSLYEYLLEDMRDRMNYFL